MNKTTLTSYDAEGTELYLVHDVYGGANRVAYDATTTIKGDTATATIFHREHYHALPTLVARVEGGSLTINDRIAAAIRFHIKSTNPNE